MDRVVPNEPISDSNLQTAFRVGMALSDLNEITLPDGSVGYLVPDGFKIEKFPQLDAKLTRIRAAPRMDDPDSFVEYFNRYKTEHSVIFADIDKNTILGILDYHAGVGGAGESIVEAKADYLQHRVSHPCPWSIDWKRWRAIDGQTKTQKELGIFLEEMLHTIAEPAGALLLEIASELKVDREVKFKSGSRLNDGTVALAYEETDSTSGKNGKIVVPQDLTIVCPVFQGCDNHQFGAKLRYSLDRGELKFKIDILNRQQGEQDAFEKLVMVIGNATQRQVFYGGN